MKFLNQRRNIQTLQIHKDHLKKLIKSVYSKTPTFTSNHIPKIVMLTLRKLRKDLLNNT